MSLGHKGLRANSTPLIPFLSPPPENLKPPDLTRSILS